MPFTESQRSQFVAALENKGWRLRENILWSPSAGLYFNDSHFQQWDPKEVRDIFTARANRIQRAALQNWETSTNENRQVSDAAEAVLTTAGT
jgi:hypothetical protein